MEKINECEFEGSQLQTEIRNCKKEHFNSIKTHTKIALEKQPNSLFWKQALEMIEKHKFNKMKK